MDAITQKARTMKITTVESGTFALIHQTKDGRITQIGLSPEQSDMLQIFLASISKDRSLIQMPSEYDLVLKNK